jgi:acetyl-CoA carboxylase carboxyl transferase subunit beta
MTSTTAGTPDWRDAILTDSTPLESSPAVRCFITEISGHHAVVASWDFSHQGGSFGELDATVFVAATDVAVERAMPVVTLLRSGGTRLPEGMRALVGIPRTALALRRLRLAKLAHISVADHPTTGGVWVGIGSTADVRIAVEGALVGFSGPRAVTAMTGRDLAEGANTAAAAYDAGLVDVVVPGADAIRTVGKALGALVPDEPAQTGVPDVGTPPLRDAWDQVTASRMEERSGGTALIEALMTDVVPLRGADQTVAAAIGRLAGRRVVAAALTAERSVMPSPAGYALLTRAARLAGDLGPALVVFVDTPGADPHTEASGLAASIATAMTAVLECPSPTISFVHGEGGSGGALAGAVTDVVGVGPHAWFAAMGPEGAAATLRIEPSEAARRMQITPADLLSSGFGDVYVPTGLEAGWLATTIDRLGAEPPDRRISRRLTRWSAPLPHTT